MNDVDRHALVGEALGSLIDGLQPYVARVFTGILPSGTHWPDLLRAKDATNGRRGGEYRDRDLSLMLRAMTERLGELGYPFSRHLSRQAENYARELRTVRNQWAHNELFSAAEAYRAIDSVELLLRAINADEQAARAAELKASVAPGPAANQSTDAGNSTQPNSTGGSQPPPHGAAARPRIDISAVSDLSYAMAHCRIPVIDHITVDEVERDLHSAVLEVDVVSANGSHGGPREVHLDVVAQRPTILSNVDLKLDPASMLEVDEQSPGDIRVVLRDSSGQVLTEANKSVNIWPPANGKRPTSSLPILMTLSNRWLPFSWTVRNGSDAGL